MTNWRCRETRTVQTQFALEANVNTSAALYPAVTHEIVCFPTRQFIQSYSMGILSASAGCGDQYPFLDRLNSGEQSTSTKKQFQAYRFT
jgi:hypothetical protein